MNVMCGLILVGSCAGLLACGSSSDGGGSTGTGNTLSSGFAANCAGCHGSTAGGGSGPALGGNVGSLSAFTATVRYGRGSMPAIGTSSYTDADLQADYNRLK